MLTAGGDPLCRGLWKGRPLPFAFKILEQALRERSLEQRLNYRL